MLTSSMVAWFKPVGVVKVVQLPELPICKGAVVAAGAMSPTALPMAAPFRNSVVVFPAPGAVVTAMWKVPPAVRPAVPMIEDDPKVNTNLPLAFWLISYSGVPAAQDARLPRIFWAVVAEKDASVATNS